MNGFFELNEMSDGWLAAKRLKDKGDKKSLKKLQKMEDTKLIPIDSKQKSELVEQVKKDCKNSDYVQGQKECPVCNGVVNFTWSKFEGFTIFECSKNDCLPWPGEEQNKGGKKDCRRLYQKGMKNEN